MNKLLTKIVGAALGVAMTVGVGVAVASNQGVAKAEAGTETITLNVSIEDYITDNSCTVSSGTDVTNYKTLSLNSDITLATDGTAGNEGSFWNDSSLGYVWKLYNGGANSAGTLTLSAASGCTITKFAYTWSSAKNSGCLATSKGQNKTNSDKINSGTEYNVGTTVCVADTSNKTNGQVAIKSIKVIYTKETTDTLQSINIATTSGSQTAATAGSVEQTKTLQLYLTAKYQTAGALDKTNDATWSVVNGTGSATVNKGLVTGGSVGTATIKATFGGLTEVEFALTVVAGPTVTLSVHSINMLTNVTRNNITITTANWENIGTPTISASSNNTSALVASIAGNGNLQLVTQDIYSDASVEVTVSATAGGRTETDKITVSVKAPTFTIADSVTLKPKQAAATYSATVTNFDNDVALDADDFDSTIIGVTVDGLNVTITPKKEGNTSITVIAYDGSNRMIERTISVSIQDADTYTLLTDVSNLFDTANIIITDSTPNYALSTTQNNNNRAETEVAASDNVITNPSASVQIIELEKDESNYYLKVGDGEYLYAPTGNSNYLRTANNKASSHAWTLTTTAAGAATIKAVGLDKYLRYNSGSGIFSCYGTASSQGGIQIYLKDAAAVAVEDVKLTGTVSATTGDAAWDTSSLVFSVLYEGDEEYTVIPNASVTFNVTESVPTITETTTTKVHVTASLKTDTSVKIENVEITANLTFENVYAIDQLYTKSVGETITIYGQFMGSYGKANEGSLVAQDGIFIGNGSYAALVYKCTANIGTSGLNLVAYESYVKVTGTISEYRGLRELGSSSAAPTLTKVTAEEAAPFFSPILDHTFTGNEDAVDDKNMASRPALVEGEVTAISGEFASDDNTTVTIELTNGNEVNVFLKANQDIDYSGLEEACTVGADIRLKVFISIFADTNAGTPYFQLVNPTLVEVSSTYFAVDFARDLLSATDAVCSLSDDGNGEALVGVWRTLKNDKFSTLADAEITTLRTATANYNDAVITAQTTDAEIISFAMGRYNLIAKKYAVALGDNANFIGRTDVNNAPINPVSSNAGIIAINSSNTAAIIAIVSVISLSAVAGFFLLRKRKEQ